MKRCAILLFFASLLAACGGGHTPSPEATCGPPPPSPAPFLALVYPKPSATGVPTTAGVLVFAGFADALKIDMSTSAGVHVPVGTPTAAPSPLPTPYATPANGSGNVAYFAAPIPPLSSATTYSVSFTYTGYNGVPPACFGPLTQSLGGFTTR